MEIIVLIAAVALIGVILWWFFAPHKTSSENANVTENHQQVKITVSGGYSPEKVVLKRGVPATLIFHRKDTSNCLEEVVLPDFGIKQKLPIGEDFPIEINTEKAGEFQYSCGMHMFFGKVVIK